MTTTLTPRLTQIDCPTGCGEQLTLERVADTALPFLLLCACGHGRQLSVDAALRIDRVYVGEAL